MLKIKHLITAMSIIAIISCSPQPAFAQSQEYKEAIEMCNNLTMLAQKSQIHRQTRNDFHELILLADSNPLVEYVMLQAYKLPLVENNKKVEVSAWFAQETQKWCYNRFILQLEPKVKGSV